MQYRRPSRPGRRDERVQKKQGPVTAAFEEFASGSVSDLGFLVNGMLQARILVPLVRLRDGLTGNIVVEIGEGDQGVEASVIASTFGPIQPSTNGVPLAIPLEILFAEELEDWAWASLTEEQSELRRALRWACAAELEKKKRKGIPQTEEEKPVAEPVPPLPTTALHVRHLKEKPRFWRGNRFHHVDARGSVDFERRLVKDTRVLVLVRADDDHELSPLLDTHQEVVVEMGKVFDAEYLSAEVGDLHEIGEARKMVAKYLTSILPKIGYGQKEGLRVK